MEIKSFTERKIPSHREKQEYQYNKNIYFKGLKQDREKILKSARNKININDLNLEFQYIVCVNCNGQIHLNDIEEHSNSCTSVRQEVMLSERDSVSFINFKIDKLLEHLTSLDNNQKEQDYLKEIEYIRHIISDNLKIKDCNHKSLTDLKKSLKIIDTKIEKFKGSFFILILYERARLLFSEKVRIMKDYLRYEELNKNPKQKSIALKIGEMILRTTEDSKKQNDPSIQTFFSSSKNGKISPRASNQIISIDSELEKKEEDNFSLSSASACSDLTSQVGFLSFIANPNTSGNDEDYKEFVKLLLKVKFEKMHNEHSGQRIDHKIIWNEIQKNKLPKQEWEEFITNRIKYVALSSKKNVKRELFSRAVGMDVIDEEV